MGYPSMSALRHGNLPDLPEGAWAKILMSLGIGDTCASVEKFCHLSKSLERVCNENFYEILNQKLGWYGDASSLEELKEKNWPLVIPNSNTAKEWFIFTCEVRRIISEDEEDFLGESEIAQNHPFLKEIKLEFERIFIVDLLFEKLDALKAQSRSQKNWTDWVCTPYEVIEGNDPLVLHAVATLDNAVQHLRTALVNIDDPTSLVYEFHKLVEIWLECVDTFPHDKIPEAFLYLRNSLNSFLECTTLKSTFEFVPKNRSLLDAGFSRGEHGLFREITGGDDSDDCSSCGNLSYNSESEDSD